MERAVVLSLFGMRGALANSTFWNQGAFVADTEVRTATVGALFLSCQHLPIVVS